MTAHPHTLPDGPCPGARTFGLTVRNCVRCGALLDNGDTRMTTETATFVVIESTPGYMPDADEPAVFDNYADAVAYANELCNELEEQGYTVDRSWASQDNLFAAHATRDDTIAPDLGRTIQVVRDDT